MRGWQDGSAVKSPGRSFIEFNSQHPHGSSQLFVTPVPGDRTPSHNINKHKIEIIFKMLFKKIHTEQNRTGHIPISRRDAEANSKPAVKGCMMRPYLGKKSQAVVVTPLILGLRKAEASLVYRVSSRTARAVRESMS